MKNKKVLMIALICLIGIGISIFLSGRRPFKDLEAAQILFRQMSGYHLLIQQFK